MKRTSLVLLLGLASFEAGCVVSQGKYDALAKTLAQTRDELGRTQQRAVDESLAREAERAHAAGELQRRDAQLAQLAASEHNLQAALDEATAIHQHLRDELKRLGSDVDRVLIERGTLQKSLEDAKVRLDELRRAQAVAAERLAFALAFTRSLQPLVDRRQVAVTARDGLLVVRIPGDSLFEGGAPRLRASARDIVDPLARALGTARGRRFEVTAHVDPLAARGAANAWELSLARATAVVRALAAKGASANALAATGYGDTMPLVSNDSDVGRAMNRRVELTLLLGRDDLVAPPTTSSTEPISAPKAP